jgi:hypothetical protein
LKNQKCKINISLSATVAEAATILPVTPVAHPRYSVVIGGLHILSVLLQPGCNNEKVGAYMRSKFNFFIVATTEKV